MEIFYSNAFKRQLRRLARRYRHIKDDIDPILDALKAGETPGDQLTGQGYTLFKVRAKNSDSQRGKSGGYRIIYYLKMETQCILVTIYAKSKQDDISPDALSQLMREVSDEHGLE